MPRLVTIVLLPVSAIRAITTFCEIRNKEEKRKRNERETRKQKKEKRSPDDLAVVNDRNQLRGSEGHRRAYRAYFGVCPRNARARGERNILANIILVLYVPRTRLTGDTRSDNVCTCLPAPTRSTVRGRARVYRPEISLSTRFAVISRQQSTSSALYTKILI